jgi:hypothetical protein
MTASRRGEERNKKKKKFHAGSGGTLNVDETKTKQGVAGLQTKYLTSRRSRSSSSRAATSTYKHSGSQQNIHAVAVAQRGLVRWCPDRARRKRNIGPVRVLQPATPRHMHPNQGKLTQGVAGCTCFSGHLEVTSTFLTSHSDEGVSCTCTASFPCKPPNRYLWSSPSYSHTGVRCLPKH